MWFIVRLGVQHVVKELSPHLEGGCQGHDGGQKDPHLDLPPPLEIVLHDPLILDSAHLGSDHDHNIQCKDRC